MVFKLAKRSSSTRALPELDPSSLFEEPGAIEVEEATGRRTLVGNQYAAPKQVGVQAFDLQRSVHLYPSLKFEQQTFPTPTHH